MRVLSLLAGTASLASLAAARIDGVAIPDTIKPGDGFNAVLLTEDYIQAVYDVSIVFGVQPRPGHLGSLGTVLGSFYLGPEQSNTRSNITKWVPVPSDLPKGPSVFAAALTSLYGVGSSPVLEYFNASITVGDSTSTNYVVADQVVPN